MIPAVCIHNSHVLAATANFLTRLIRKHFGKSLIPHHEKFNWKSWKSTYVGMEHMTTDAHI